jgi:5-methylcytosine-specific restriction endonuclease McrBC GTP-binding regulatory subunit McrB
MEENKLIMTTVKKNELLKKFLKKWPIDKLEKMTLEEYTNHNKNSFIYWLEHITKPLGSIRGGGAHKFGIYAASNARNDKTCIGNNDYAWCRKYGDSQEKAFIEVRNKVLSIATCARENKWEDIDKIDFGEAIKWKIAFLYSDKKLIPFFNKKNWLIPIAERLGFASDEKKVKVSKLNIFILSKKETNQDLFDFCNELVNTLKNDTTNKAIKTEVIEKYDETNFLEEVFIEENDFETITTLLERKKNIILQGAPGVGKTFAAKKIAYSMIGKEDEDLIKIVQFHQNYSYEDFVEGYKPNEDGSFELKDGVFKKFCKDAEQDDKNKYFFIIDEINRGNLSKIFGELLMLIEDTHRGETINLAYSGGEFCVPENVYIIGMMNTADRSLAMIDYALRRRVSFFEMQPAFENDKFKKMMEGKGNLMKVIEAIEKLNEEICKDASLGKGFCIGHSYFCNLTDDNEETLQNIIDYEIAPMLKEYWFDDINKYNKEIELLNESLNDNSQEHSN